MTRLPSALFVVRRNEGAHRLLKRLTVSAFLYSVIVDTNSDPKNIDYIIPANDDAKDSVEAILAACCGAIAEGLEERKAEKADEKAAAEQAEEAAEAKPKRAARKAEEAPKAENEAPVLSN